MILLCRPTRDAEEAGSARYLEARKRYKGHGAGLLDSNRHLVERELHQNNLRRMRSKCFDRFIRGFIDTLK